jgi:SAM-dependent methyltransferase
MHSGMSVNRHRSTIGARVSGRRSGQRFDAENGTTTEALIFLGDLDPEAIGPSIAHATHYEPTPVGDFATLLRHVPFALEHATFVDIGSGMGRAVILAASLPFKTVIGVEFSRALHEVAKENLARIDPATLRCRDVRLVCADAASYRFPRGALVAYLYNPFDATILSIVLERLTATARRELTIVYHTPVERATIESNPAFELVAEEAAGSLYRLRTT